jgi:hypothetical protein
LSLENIRGHHFCLWRIDPSALHPLKKGHTLKIFSGLEIKQSYGTQTTTLRVYQVRIYTASQAKAPNVNQASVTPISPANNITFPRLPLIRRLANFESLAILDNTWMIIVGVNGSQKTHVLTRAIRSLIIPYVPSRMFSLSNRKIGPLSGRSHEHPLVAGSGSVAA